MESTKNKKSFSLPSNFWIIFSVIVGVFLILFPFVFSSYMVRVACTVMVYAILAMSLNVMCGYCGILSMGHAAFLCVGSYVAALTMKNFGFPWLLAACAAFVAAGILGFVLALPTLKLSGAFLVMVTIGFNEIIKTIALSWRKVTGGALGIKGIPGPKIGGFTFTLYNKGFYFLAVALMIIFGLVCQAVKSSSWGRTMRAIKDDELAVSMVGVYPVRYKILAFVIGSSIAGFVGAYYASLLGFIDPTTFSADMSKIILCAVLLGGLGNVPAMAFGAVIIVAIQEVFRFASEFRYVAFGLMLIILMRYAPEGFFGRPSKKPYKLPHGVTVKKNDGGK